MRYAAATLALLAAAATTQAGTVIKLTLDDLGQPPSDPDVAWRGGTFGTLSDGVGSTNGQQNTAVDFVGALNGVADIAAGGSFTISGIDASAPPMAFGGVVIQPTRGGEMRLYDDLNNLLLSAQINDGSISGSSMGSAASFFTIDSMVLTGGSLLPLLAPSPSGLAIALTDVDSGGAPGLRIIPGPAGQPILANFTASATVNLDAVPAPASSLVLAGLLGITARRRRA